MGIDEAKCANCRFLAPKGNNILAESKDSGQDGEGRAAEDDDDPSWWDEDACLVAIDLGYDEGGRDDTLLVSVQAGITEQARKFKKEWRRRLIKANNLPCFHSVDFNNYTSGVFTKSGLDRKDRIKLLADLCGLIHNRLLYSMTTRVQISEYNSLCDQNFRSRHGTAYGFAIDMCLLWGYIIATTESRVQPHFNILIEQGHRNSEQVAQILDAIKKFLPQIAAQRTDVIQDIRVLSAGLGSKKDHPILQAADMSAYSEWQRLSHGDRTIWDALRLNAGRYRNGFCGRRPDAVHKETTKAS